MLQIDIRVGEQIKVGEAVLTLEAKSGQTARLAIDAPRSVKIERISQHSPAQMAAAGGISGKP